MKTDKDVSDILGMNYVDEEYETRMLSFEMDCNEGKGAPEACMQNLSN